MKTLRCTFFATFGLAAIFSSGCSSPEVEQSLPDRDFASVNLQKVGVVAATTDVPLRRTTEDLMRAAISPRAAVTGYMLLGPFDERRNLDRLQAAAQEAGAETLLVLKYLERGTYQRSGIPLGQQSHVEQLLGNFYQPRDPPREWFPDPFRTEERLVLVQTRLYRVKTGQLLWSASSTVKDRGTNQELLERIGPALHAQFASLPH